MFKSFQYNLELYYAIQRRNEGHGYLFYFYTYTFF